MAVSAYYDTPEAWASGADPIYEALSRAIVASSPTRFEGRTIGDLGAGTGATSRAIAEAGGRPVALDLAWPMLAHNRAARPPAAVADMTQLPVSDGRLGGLIAAFSLSHVDDPIRVLREAARATARGGPVLAGVFAATGVRHAVTPIVESLAAKRGWTAPAWYVDLKEHLEPQVATRESLVLMARAAGLEAINVSQREVAAGLDSPEALVQWRLSGPAMAPFANALDKDDLISLYEEARRALGADIQPLRPAVCILSSVAPARR